MRLLNVQSQNLTFSKPVCKQKSTVYNYLLFKKIIGCDVLQIFIRADNKKLKNNFKVEIEAINF